MADVHRLLEARMAAAFGAVSPGADPVLRRSEHADFQANGALALARSLGRDPRQVAGEVVAAADLAGICERVEVSGPGFINLRLDDAFLADQLTEMASDARLGVPEAPRRQVVVVDYSAPNVAKEMHVGHLRTTIIGDCLCRVLGFLGHEVIRENHVGDWGTPFGMLIEHLVDLGETEAANELSVGDLDAFYKQARASFDADETFRERSRRRVVLLQSGDAETLRLWGILVAESVRYFDEVYARLDVLLTDEDIVGESFYNPELPAVVAELRDKGLLVESDGALCVFPEGFGGRDGEALPLIVQKSDGGFGYAATDLATLRDRTQRLGAELLLYVVGAPQAQHLSMCFAVAKMAGWLDKGAEPVHVSFGHVLGPDRKMLKTRAGTAIKLVALLDEAVARASCALSERSSALTDGERAALARSVGIGAVKYADLSTERSRDYVFDWERMLAFDGDTGPYLQYAYARIRSIFRRGGDASVDRVTTIASPAEHELALELLGFAEAVEAVASSRSPSRLTGHLYGLASAFTAFYESAPVLRAETEELRHSRLALCSLTAATLRLGLGLLGIDAPEQM